MQFCHIIANFSQELICSLAIMKYVGGELQLHWLIDIVGADLIKMQACQSKHQWHLSCGAYASESRLGVAVGDQKYRAHRVRLIRSGLTWSSSLASRLELSLDDFPSPFGTLAQARGKCVQ